MKIRKAVFPVAGLGTRFLPATKAMPKEMLPVVDKPLIQYAVEEALASGIEQIIFVTGSGKSALEDHFDRSFQLEETLKQRNKIELLQVIESIVRIRAPSSTPARANRSVSATPSGAPGISSATSPSPSCWPTT